MSRLNDGLSRHEVVQAAKNQIAISTCVQQCYVMVFRPDELYGTLSVLAELQPYAASLDRYFGELREKLERVNSHMRTTY